jgi:2-(1,2-epoxy-1,2-dihydrophenyl)acetyl-CoA isomerase
MPLGVLGGIADIRGITMGNCVTVERHGPVSLVRLNREASYNALELETARTLHESLVSLAVDRTVRAVVLTGSGRAFCSGGDLKWIAAFPKGAGAAFYELASRFHGAVLEIRRMEKPVIAAVNGVAAGGGFSLALACDFRVMSKRAILRQAYTSSGLCLDGGGTFSLPRIVGLARALEITAFDEPISAAKALTWGLVTKIVEDTQIISASLDMASALSDKSIHAFGVAKRLLTDSFDTSFEIQMENERRALVSCAEHQDGIEGLNAFVAKRSPSFTRI